MLLGSSRGGSPDEDGGDMLEALNASFEICGRRGGRDRRGEDAEDRDEPRVPVPLSGFARS